MDMQQASTVTLEKGRILGDESTTTAVKYLDCTSLLDSGQNDVYVEVICTADMYLMAVESGTPAIAPTIIAESGDACMWGPASAGQPFSFRLTRDNPFLAYSADAGKLRVRRASPSNP